ncbi:MAG: ABC transporter ATP-binding protein [Lentisphaerales bacterium]|nr:ABC transporter ATP-binding protein [Lentisphaerales bacterium]
MEGQALLKLENITRKFGDFTAVNGISLEVIPGEIFALLGPNGAGKTTCMKMITGTLQATSGSASLSKNDCFQERHLCMAQTGYVPDDPTYPPFIRASELIRFQGEMHGLDKDTIARSTEPLIERLELSDALEDFATNFSKGMKKKLAVVLALIHQPRLLVLDELTNGLDPYATRDLHQLMCEQRDAGAAILFSTHLLDQAEKLCDRLAIIQKGKISICGSIEQIREDNDDLEQLFFRHTSLEGETSQTVEED